MDPDDTVSGLVTALIATYNAALEDYTRWQRQQWQQNSYDGREKGQLSGSDFCGLSTSLNFSATTIRAKYNTGVEMYGNSFVVGNERCREVLRNNLDQLQPCAEALHGLTKTGRGPVGLYAILRTSEAVRISTVYALDRQPAEPAPIQKEIHTLSDFYQQPTNSMSLPDGKMLAPGFVLAEHTAAGSGHSLQYSSLSTAPPPLLTIP